MHDDRKHITILEEGDPEMIIDTVRDYFMQSGVGESDLEFLKESGFMNACLFRLPNVCIIAQNRETPSHQSHIHVTGGRMKVFFTTMEIARNEEIAYMDQQIVLSSLNIAKLRKEQTTGTDIGLFDAVMRKKLALRADFTVQVQLGERLRDSIEFNTLREGLYKDDYMAALRFLNEDKILVLGIPKDFMETDTANIYEEYNMSLPDFTEYYDEDDISDGSDAVYQNAIQSELERRRSHVTYSNNPVPFRSGFSPRSGSTRAYTNPQLGKAAMEQNDFRCAFDLPGRPHETFIAVSGKPYLEAHHLIPMAKQPLFENRLDVISNIIPLCPTCHRRIHIGVNEDRKKMLTELYEKRKDDLEKGIGKAISLEELLSYYEID